GVDNIVPDFLSRRDGSNCIRNDISFEPRYLYDSPDTCAAINSLNNDREDEWPDHCKTQLKQQQNRFMVKDNHVWRQFVDKSKTTADMPVKETWVKFIPFKRQADLVEDFHRGFGHQGKTTINQLMKNTILVA
ncbi:hypothetical protein INT47_009905, partial [Mucor saturninus]